MNNRPKLSSRKYSIMQKKVSNLILDKLQFVGWKLYTGDDAAYTGYWVKDGVAISIVPARRMNKMHHLHYLTVKTDENKFLEEDQLIRVIESGKL